jgi:TolB-like protein/DNA-binding winged helix-turn-helix (wHTH) protein
VAQDPSRAKAARFGRYTLDLRSRELFKDGRRIRLQDKPFQILAALLERPGKVVSREEIRTRLWPADTFVDFDHSLGNALNRLRQVLNDSAENPRYIETLPKRGFRFIAPIDIDVDRDIDPTAPAVEPAVRAEPRVDAAQPHALGAEPSIDAAASPTEPVRPPARRWPLAVAASTSLLLLAGVTWGVMRATVDDKTERLVLVVLPLENLTGDAAQDYFADGLTEEIITELSRLNHERLGVIARTTAMRYGGSGKSAAEIGRELGAHYLLEGSVRREGKRVRIAAQLVETRDETHRWAEAFERDADTILTLQRDIARAVAERIELTLTPEQQIRLTRTPAVHPEAYHSYLRGRYYWNKRTSEGFQKAIVEFDAAIATDPRFARAYAGLADSYYLIGFYSDIPFRDAMMKARAAAERALELDPDLAEAHTSLAVILAYFEWDFEGADREFRRALQLDPSYPTGHHWYGIYLFDMGRMDEAVREVLRAVASDPLSVIINTDLALTYYHARRYERSIRPGSPWSSSPISPWLTTRSAGHIRRTASTGTHSGRSNVPWRYPIETRSSWANWDAPMPRQGTPPRPVRSSPA